MKKNKNKPHNFKLSDILSRIVILLFLSMLMLFININSVAFHLNRSVYESVPATITEETTDEFLLLIPKVKVSYTYQGQSYSEKKFFLLEPLFGLSSEKGTTLTLYVNTKAPNHSLFDVSFFFNILNWILLILEIACIYNLIRKIQEYYLQHKRRTEVSTS